MITWIGLCAGEIWHFLDSQRGQASLESLISRVNAPKETIFMALGWLAREGFIVIHGIAPDSVIRLKELT